MINSESLASELKIKFIHAAGPGGQNVNKVATCAQIYFDVANSSLLNWEIKMRLTKLAGRKMTKDGILIIEAKRFRSQDKNKLDGLERLDKILIEAQTPPPPPRKKSKPTKSSVEKRLSEKKLIGLKKKNRKSQFDD